MLSVPSVLASVFVYVALTLMSSARSRQYRYVSKRDGPVPPGCQYEGLNDPPLKGKIVLPTVRVPEMSARAELKPNKTTKAIIHATNLIPLLPLITASSSCLATPTNQPRRLDNLHSCGHSQ